MEGRENVRYVCLDTNSKMSSHRSCPYTRSYMPTWGLSWWKYTKGILMNKDLCQPISWVQFYYFSDCGCLQVISSFEFTFHILSLVLDIGWFFFLSFCFYVMILGDMWGRFWTNLYPLAMPYQGEIDVSKTMVEKVQYNRVCLLFHSLQHSCHEISRKAWNEAPQPTAM